MDRLTPTYLPSEQSAGTSGQEGLARKWPDRQDHLVETNYPPPR